ncbi:hypothetical protein FISHEDRAFT_71119 [Fistulina hepatica ATCC 64428]|nr:hypothetical protein FISHEDRAFT_71119 [Fistulina hepatica ATCC 64428]
MPRNIPVYDEKQWENPDVTVDRTWYTGEKSHQVGRSDDSRFDVDPAVETSDENGQPPSQMVEAVPLSRQESATRSEPGPSRSSSSTGRRLPSQAMRVGRHIVIDAGVPATTVSQQCTYRSRTEPVLFSVLYDRTI